MVAAALVEGVSPGTRWTFAGVALILTVGASYLFRRLSAAIVEHGGLTYDGFQRAGSAAALRLARETWGPASLVAARKAWTLDLVFPAIYSVLGALLSSLAASYSKSRDWDGLATAMAVVSWLSIVAGGVDLLVENTAVAVNLWARPTDAAARVARAAGFVKRALITLVLVALLVALVALAAVHDPGPSRSWE